MSNKDFILNCMFWTKCRMPNHWKWRKKQMSSVSQKHLSTRGTRRLQRAKKSWKNCFFSNNSKSQKGNWRQWANEFRRIIIQAHYSAHRNIVVKEFDTNTSQRAAKWHYPDDPKSKTSRPSRSKAKVILLIFFDYHCVVYSKFVRNGSTVKKKKIICTRLILWVTLFWL